MKRIFIWMVVAVLAIASNAARVYAGTSGISVRTQIFDGNSQPPIVGGIIDNYTANEVQKKGIIVSANSSDVGYKESEYMYDPSCYAGDWKSVDANLSPLGTKDYRMIDCSAIGADQFWCSLKLLKSATDYYVRAFVVKTDGTTVMGNVEKVHTQSYSRYSGKSDYANVWYAFSNTLFDLVTDEIINPNNGFYYSTNENPTNVRFQKGTSYNTCYKFATEWNYKLWYYHNANHCNKSKIINLPIMTYSNGKLTIEKNPLDADKSITLYYGIDGDYFRPENYTDIYQQPLSISSPCTVYCYAISSDGYISYTNMYVVGDLTDNNSETPSTGDVTTEDNGKYVEVCGVKWARGNLQYDAVNGGDRSFQTNWRIAPSQWHFFRYDISSSTYTINVDDEQIDHFTWGTCGNWNYLHNINYYSQATNTDLSAKMYIDEECSKETSDYSSAKYGDLAYWASKGQYRLPTVEEIDLLINQASYQYGYYLTNEGVKVYGLLFSTPSGTRTTNTNAIQLSNADLSSGLFLPYAGGAYSKNQYIQEIQSKVDIWSSTANANYPQTLRISGNRPERGRYNSYYGQWRTDLLPIRPVFLSNNIIPSEYSSEDRLVVKDVTTLSGKTVSVGIELENKTTDFTAFQFDLTLPEGLELATDDKGKYMVAKTSRYEDDAQSLNISKMGDNRWRFVCFSLSNGTIEETSGAILKAVLAVEDAVETGTYEAVISNVVFTKADGTQLMFNDAKFNIVVSNMLQGDANGDGYVNVSDIVEVVNYILGKASGTFDEAVVDMNGDGIVNVTDVVMMVSIIMSGQYDAARSTMEMAEATTDNDRLTLSENGDSSLSLRLENEGGYVAAQFEVKIDADMALESITMNDQRSGGHQLIYAKTGDNIYKVIVYSVSNTAFGGHDGELLSIRTKGSGNVTLDNILFVTDGQKERPFTPLYGNTTGIETIQPSTINRQNSYDLQGRKVENVQLKKGVYIVNGKKQVVR